MPVVLFNHGNTGAQVSSEVVYRHSVVSEHYGGVVAPKAVHGALLAVAILEYRLVKWYLSHMIS
jgi:hypothetical protein